jgi:hypothetical protein
MVPNGERQRAEQGLREALDRLDNRISDSNLGDPWIPFAEALNWLYSLEEWHKEELKAVGVDYYVRRDSDPDGRIVAGVVYARGLVAHQLTLVSMLVVGVFPTFFPSVFPGGEEWRWRRFLDLPPPSKKENHQRDQRYVDYVEDEPLLTILRAAERFLTITVKSYYP